MTVCGGLALYPDDAGSPRQRAERAGSVALAAAKRRGRDRVVSWAGARDSNERLRPE